MKKAVCLILFALFLTGGQLCLAQTSNQGVLVGTIKDQNDNVIPGVAVTVSNIETGVTKETATDERGSYRIDFLLPGNYRIDAEASGFRRAQIQSVVVHVSEVQRADLQMEVGQVNEQVTVNSDSASAVNTENPTIGEVIDERIIENMPLNGREFIELAGLVPGVSTGSGKTGSVESKGLAAAVGGARSSYNSYYVDGADSTDNYFGQLVSSPALDAIKEFRVETSLYSAKYGR